MDENQYAWRTVVPVSQLALYTLAPIVLLYTLAVTPLNSMRTAAKQIISIPLLACLLIMPYIYVDSSNGSFSAFCQLVPFTMFLRFFDVFWITPVIYGKDAYIAKSDLNAEFWSSVKKSSKPNRVTQKDEEKKATPIVKNKRFYHLFTPILINTVMFDVIAAWVKTFTEQDLIHMQKSNFGMNLVFFLAVVTGLTSLLNLGGNVMQLCYCLYVDHGWYAPDEWRNIMNYPLLGTSLEEVWSRRWHRVLRPAWIASGYKPVYFLTRKWIPGSNKFIAIFLSSMAVFVLSGVTHEFVVLCNAGWKVYKQTYMGQQMIFFGTHGVLVVLEKAAALVYKKVVPKSAIDSPLIKVLLNMYVVTVATWTFPYFINGFAHWGLWRVDSLTPLEPAVQAYLANNAYLRQFCGSRI